MATPPPAPRRPLSNAANLATPRNRLSETNPARSMTATPPSAGAGLARNPSLRGARPVRRAPARASIGGDLDDSSDAASKDANDELVAHLREQVERAEQASELYRKQLEVLQQKLDEANDLETAAEERDFAAKTQIDKLMADVRENVRQKREMELAFESERSSLLQDKDRTMTRADELQAVVNRLTDTLKTRSMERQNTARIETMHALEGIETPTGGQNEELMHAVHERDNVIETLKLELADFHLKAAEQEHMGDGRQQALEKELRDIKMQNARLVEENDSFQMLLSEKTLKGDFLHDANRDSGGMSSLAEELEGADEHEEISTEAYRKMEADLKTVREKEKALTIYIDKIIGRLLQHDGFEHIITGKDADEDSSMPPPRLPLKEKPLPAAPSKALPQHDGTDAPATTVGGFLQRARSVVSRAPVSKVRPTSYAQQPPPQQQPPSANENPQTAPSIPFNKGHRRARSDQASQDLTAASIAQQMNKGSPLRVASGSPMGPAISPLGRASTSTSTSYFVPPGVSAQTPTTATAPRAPSQAGTADRSSSANSIVSEHSLERQSTEATSYPASTHTGSKEPVQGGNIPGAVMKQNQLRPLRLVQETGVEDEAARRGNRSSWMGWFNKPAAETQQQQ